jgi:hypothetical protein
MNPTPRWSRTGASILLMLAPVLGGQTPASAPGVPLVFSPDASLILPSAGKLRLLKNTPFEVCLYADKGPVRVERIDSYSLVESGGNSPEDQTAITIEPKGPFEVSLASTGCFRVILTKDLRPGGGECRF